MRSRLCCPGRQFCEQKAFSAYPIRTEPGTLFCDFQKKVVPKQWRPDMNRRKEKKEVLRGEEAVTDEQNARIEQLYHELFVPLTMYARSALQNNELAEEAVQDTFRIACAKPEALCASPNPKGWLLNTLKYVLRNIARSQIRTVRLVSAISQDHEPSDTDREELNILYGTLAETEEFRLLQGIADGKTVLELAQERGIGLEACKKRIQRARKYLQKKLQYNGYGNGDDRNV